MTEYIISPSCKLPPKLVNWLRDVVKPSGDKRGLILLSHHQYNSAFEDRYEKAARQLAEFIDRPVLWFWGHEHRLALYGSWEGKNGITTFGGCVGHGGMPIQDFYKLPRGNYKDRHLVTYDARPNRWAGLVKIGFNGYVNLRFNGNQLSIDYLDIKGTSLLTEEWEVDTASGELKGLGVTSKVDLDVPGGLNLPPVSAIQE